MLILSMGAAAAQRRTIFFEVGANNGNFSAELLARRASNRAHVDEVYLFEPNPRFARELALLHGRYGATHVQKAAWVEDGHKTFYFSRNDEASSLVGGAKRHKSAATVHDAWTKMPCRPAAEYAASTAYAALERAWDGTIARRAAYGHGSTPICDTPRAEKVETVDLAAFVAERTHINRTAVGIADRVLMKMDIEGAEGRVFEHLLSTGVACARLNVIMVEWHAVVPREEQSRLARSLRACGVTLLRGSYDLLAAFGRDRPWPDPNIK